MGAGKQDTVILDIPVRSIHSEADLESSAFAMLEMP